GPDGEIRRGAGLRIDHRFEDGGKPSVRRDDYGRVLLAVRRKSDGPADGNHVERRHGILQAGGHQRYRRAGCAHDDRARIRRPRSDWAWRAADGIARRGDIECGGECDWSSRAYAAAYAR